MLGSGALLGHQTTVYKIVKTIETLLAKLILLTMTYRVKLLWHGMALLMMIDHTI